MSNIKPITINPELFKMGPTKKSKPTHNKTQKISSINTTIPSSKLKRELLKKIQRYNKPNSNKPDSSKRIINHNIKSNTSENSIEFDNEFQKSLSFLQQLSKKNSRTLKANRPDVNITIPDNFNYNSNLNTKTINNSSNDLVDHNVDNCGDNNNLVKDSNTVPYGCLKNGSKPTYRQWKNTTMKNYSNTNDNDNNNDNNSNIKNNINEMRNEIKTELSSQIQQSNNINSNLEPRNLIRTHTRSIKYKLGKSNRKISVLIKNASTRKKISSEHNKIRRTTILDMKNYLRRHHLLKAGSEAPNDVIRKLYENCLLSGEIQNTNKDNLIHNFLNKPEESFT